MTFLRTILIILLIFFGLRILFRFLKPYIMHYVAKKANEKFGEMADRYKSRTSPQEPEGKTTIVNESGQRSGSKKSVGEYIDYEEID